VAGPTSRLRRQVDSGRSDAPGVMVDLLGRVGLVGYGVVHLLVAWLALQVAFGVPDAAADAQGAVGTIARTAYGTIALVLAVVGLLAFALWQAAAAAVGFQWVRGSERVRKRVGASAKAAAMVGLSLVMVDYLAGRGSSSGEPAVRRLSAALLALPAGRILLGLLAGVVVAVAVAMTYTGLRRTFMDDLDLTRLAPPARRAIELVGAVGHLARALALAVVGVLAGTAAALADHREAGGLDSALRTLGGTALGSSLLVVVAAGFASFGVFCVADAATRRA
jgi:hypothetical protein